MTRAPRPACRKACANISLLTPAWRQILADPFALIIPLVLFIGTIIAGLILRRILFGAVRKWAARTESRLDVLLTGTLRGPIVLWSIILGLHLATQTSNIPRPFAHDLALVFEALWVSSLTIAASRFAGNAVGLNGGQMTGAQSVTSLTRKIVQLVVVAVGLVWLLKVVFDISLTPILTTLGVGGLAVALALQDTLSNLFAGFYVSISGLVRIGDYLKLSSGEEGYVTDISWRCTTMRNLFDNLVVIPNSKLGQAIYTNFSLPQRRMKLSIAVGVGYDSDVDRVAAMLLDEATTAAGSLRGLLADPAPVVLFIPGLGDWALQFQVNFHVGEFTDQYLVQSELRKLIFKRLQREKVNMPFPTQTLLIESKKAE